MLNHLVKKTIPLACLLTVFLSSSALSADYVVPKTSFGHPDLQGIWTNATMTSFERSKALGNQRALSDEEAEKLEKNNPFEMMKKRDSQKTDPNAPAPKAGGGGVGGYNAFWMDPGTKVAKVNGEYRTSIIIEPKDGQVPYTAEGRKAFVDGYAVRRSDIGFDGPEVRALGERCLVGFGSTGGPPMLSVLYNNHYQIIQSPDHVVINVEMNHDARIIRLKDKHRPNSMPQWLGDSIGHWDGSTLVVETRNFHKDQSVRSATRHRLYIPPTATVIERFTRVGPDEILYQFTVEDKEAYTSKWTGEMPMHRSPEKIFEYACHEGNYSLPGILAGAREEEKEAKK
ncbi:MAG: hypothetical protein ACRBCS_14145 [Cellvibrionaceae bacterium]